MYFNRPVVKMEVKQSVRQTRPHPMLVTLLYLVVVGVVTGLISWLMNTLFSSSISLEDLFFRAMLNGEDFIYYLESMLDYSPELFVRVIAQAGTFSLVVSILTTAWSGLMNTGYAGYCLDMSRNMNPPLEHIFSGFSRAVSVILAYILVTIFTFLWALLFTVGLIVMIFIAALLVEISRALAILSVLLILAAPILYAVALIWVSYRYVMVPFVLADSQDPITALDAIRASKTMMQGRKSSFFALRLSFIGWYLLEALVVAVGAIIATAAFADNIIMFIDRLDDMLYYGDFEELGWFLTHLLAPILPIALVCGAVIFIINLWLTPYRTGCEAHFYLYASGGTQPDPYQPGPYGSQPGPYGGQSGSYGGQFGPYGSQSGPYGGQFGPHGGQSAPYGGESGPYGGQSGPHGGQSAPHGGQSAPYNNNPYGYQPPSQSTFGGYTQGPQSPQYGTGTYTQWGAPQTTQPPQVSQAPQAPQTPVSSVVEPPAAPAAPATPAAPVIPEPPEFPETVIASVFDQAPAVPTVPETPVIPESPKFPETVIASVFDQAPAAPDDAPAEPDNPPYEAPYAEPEAPGDDEAHQQPNSPSDPQV